MLLAVVWSWARARSNRLNVSGWPDCIWSIFCRLKHCRAPLAPTTGVKPSVGVARADVVVDRVVDLVVDLVVVLDVVVVVREVVVLRVVVGRREVVVERVVVLLVVVVILGVVVTGRVVVTSRDVVVARRVVVVVAAPFPPFIREMIEERMSNPCNDVSVHAIIFQHY